ncbi:MAG: type II/IV secretion system protein [Oceanospirillaceae bacterium]|nr:type II/IV secretion system protein [Oceanospirillaceae bacterium]MCP5350438.1 type II/IV secretion system protein [Oceanospirillaceae bacterium]
MADDVKLSLRGVCVQLKNAGILSDADMETVLSKGMKPGQHPVTAIASAQVMDKRFPDKLLGEDAIMEFIGKQHGLNYFHIDPLKVRAADVTPTMSFAFAQRHGLLPVGINATEITVAVMDPENKSWIADIEHINRRKVVRVVAKPSDIKRYAVEFFTLAASVSGANAKHQGGSQLNNLESLVDLGKSNPDANDEHIVNIVDWLFQYAFQQRASDIHIEPRREVAKVRFRIDGVLQPVYEFPAQVSAAVTSRIKSLGRMNIAEKRRPQDSRLKTRTPDNTEVELRLSTMPTAFGEKLVMRIFDPDVLLRSFAELGFSREDSRRWQHMTEQRAGIILVTGPTGSGKTSTLYSTLRQLANDDVNVCSIEDPIEMVEPMFNQMQVNPALELDFASGVRTLMRQDPDIIMVGEIRDKETAQMAVQAALTGHLVLSTLHTNDAASAVTRLLDIGVPAYLIKSSLVGVMAQRLVRTLCPHCKVPDKLDKTAWEALVSPWLAKVPEKIFKPAGCLACRNTGYLGRAGIYEVMVMSDSLSQLINASTDISVLRRQAMKEGMLSLRLSGAQKVAAGLTTIEEVLRVSPAEIG